MNKLLFGKQGRWPRLGVFCAALAATAMFVVCNVTGVDPPPKNNYTLTIQTNPADGSGGTTSPSGSASYESGQSVSVTATPKDGYDFSYWSGAASGSANPATIIVNGDKSVTAWFTKKGEEPPPPPQDTTQNPPATTFTLSTTVSPAGSGTTTPVSQSGLAAGSTVSISATPANANYVFVNWTASGSPAPVITNPSSASTSVTIASNAVLTANFRLDDGPPPPPPPATQYTLNIAVTPTGAGTVVPASGGRYDAGASVTVSASPASGYTFSNWSGGATGTNPTTAVTMNSDLSITAVFVQTTVEPPPPPPPTTNSYCYWAPNADNSFTSSCVGIGGEYDDIKTAAGCTSEYGVVISDCNNPPVSQYCYWGENKCYAITDPSGPSEDNPGMTNLAACSAYGFVSSKSDCSDYVPPAVVYYCYWAGDGCYKINNPDAINEKNAPMTEKDVCEAFGWLSTDSQCTGHPTVVYYCDWGPPSSDGGGCYKTNKTEAECTGDWGEYYSSTDPNLPSRCQ